jgi:hypothetical protein
VPIAPEGLTTRLEKRETYNDPHESNHMIPESYHYQHGRMARGGHGLPKVSPGSALRPFLGWPARRAGCQRPSSTLLETPRRTPMIINIFRWSTPTYSSLRSLPVRCRTERQRSPGGGRRRRRSLHVVRRRPLLPSFTSHRKEFYTGRLSARETGATLGHGWA